MSLVIALAASREAVIGADRRAITFLGSCPRLEEELYSGQIKDDQQLLDRAGELGAVLQITSSKEKVWRRGDLLVGEVTEISALLSRRRRIYLTPGASLQVDITSDGLEELADAGACKEAKKEAPDRASDKAHGEARIRSWNGVGCTVFGNLFTQKLAYDEVGRAGGRVNEPLVKSILAKAGERTASVSRESTVLRSDIKQPDPKAALLRALEADCKENGWRLCAPQ
ncbi:MAG: hypothetical protein A4E49_01324 [Methanosaeta sp. PtaU1.Bin112]|nr:MAG: hypothetical protein A4E49_01324 [Methanosaeta sp. PtaU1.Bin112]